MGLFARGMCGVRMKFINQGEPVKIRIGKLSEDFTWRTIEVGEIIELTRAQGRALNFQKVKTTEGQIGDKIVETKQIEGIPLKEFEKEQDFFKKLNKIKGIGKKTTLDIIKVYPTEKKLIDAIKLNAGLPFRDDIEEKLRRAHG